MLSEAKHPEPTDDVVVVAVGDIAVRQMRDDAADYELMARWLTDERVLEFVYGRDNPYPLERVKAKYRPRVLGREPVVPCFLLHLGRPIGYLQYYPVTEPHDYEMDNAVGTYGVDMLIGEPELWGQGIGSHALTALVDYIFENFGAQKIVIDPRVDNGRAIRAYEKAGFRKVKVLARHEFHEGEQRDGWLMVVEPKS